MRYLKILALLVVAVASTGCLRLTYTLSLKPDGSGTIATTVAMTQVMMQQAAAMMGASESLMPTEAQMRDAAKEMGDGVRFVRATPYKENGLDGVTAVYAFDDLNKLKLNMEQAIAGSVNAPDLGGADVDPKADLKLSFTRQGDRTVLVLGMPEITPPDEESRKQVAAIAQQQPPVTPEVDAIMKQLIGGLLMEVAINIEGQILKTNAPYVEGSRIVLLRLDGNEMLKSGQGLGPLMQMGSAPDFAAQLSKIPGLKLVTLPEIRIEFR